MTFIKNFADSHLNLFYSSKIPLIGKADYGMLDPLHLAARTKKIQNVSLKVLAEFFTTIVDAMGNFLVTFCYNSGTFLYNNIYVRLRNRSIERLNLANSKKWNFNWTALKTWTVIGAGVLISRSPKMSFEICGYIPFIGSLVGGARAFIAGANIFSAYAMKITDDPKVTEAFKSGMTQYVTGLIEVIPFLKIYLKIDQIWNQKPNCWFLSILT
jgi:hypothetical protein